jgi:hypothetical protein
VVLRMDDDHLPDDKRFGASERQLKSLLERHFVIHREHGRRAMWIQRPAGNLLPGVITATLRTMDTRSSRRAPSR